MTKFYSAVVVCIVLAFAVPAFADEVTIGAPNNGSNYYPFGGYTGEYQQVYGTTTSFGSPNPFTAPFTINALQFFFGGAIGPFPTGGDFVISLSTTSADPQTLSGGSCPFPCTNFASNIGSDNTTVFNGDLAPLAPPVTSTSGAPMTINLTTPFTYNPANGNLLMDVVVSGPASGGFVGPDAVGPYYFESTTLSLATGHVDIDGVNSAPFDISFGDGLVTGFIGTPASVPEPSTFLLLGCGLLTLISAARRKSKTLFK